MDSVKLSGRALVVHGGGPTAVLNSSLAGIVEACAARAEISGVIGAIRGASGILNGNFFDLSAPSDWERIAMTAGSVLGSSRQQLAPPDFEQMISVCRRLNVRYLFVTGGNGTMEMALRLNEAAQALGHECRVIGVPKTIDNDLTGTDHSPGFASCARFFATAFRSIGADNRALPGVTVVEVLGRNVGWLTASAMLARERDDDAPHLVYLPERRLRLSNLYADVDRVYRKQGRAVVAVCEGQLDESGEPFGADARVTSRKPLALNLAHVLSRHIERELKITTRSEKPGLLGRSCAPLASAVDRQESRECGRAAVGLAAAGVSGVMVTLQRTGDAAYRSETGSVPLADVVGRERPLPEEWLPNDPTVASAGFLEWVKPLVGDLQPSGWLSRRFVEE